MIHALLLALVIGVGIGLGQRLVGTSKSGSSPRPGWHPDPWKQHRLRYWDGWQWTGYTTSD
jgi:hypothetical protein